MLEKANECYPSDYYAGSLRPQFCLRIMGSRALFCGIVLLTAVTPRLKRLIGRAKIKEDGNDTGGTSASLPASCFPLKSGYL